MYIKRLSHNCFTSIVDYKIYNQMLAKGLWLFVNFKQQTYRLRSI